MLARLVDLRDHLRQCHALGVRDLLQTAPECVFEADAGLVTINDDRAFDDWGFHEQALCRQSAGVEIILYGDSVPRLIAVETDGEIHRPAAPKCAFGSPTVMRAEKAWVNVDEPWPTSLHLTQHRQQVSDCYRPRGGDEIGPEWPSH